MTKNTANKTKDFWKLCKSFFIEKGSLYQQKFTVKTKI